MISLYSIEADRNYVKVAMCHVYTFRYPRKNLVIAMGNCIIYHFSCFLFECNFIQSVSQMSNPQFDILYSIKKTKMRTKNRLSHDVT